MIKEAYIAGQQAALEKIAKASGIHFEDDPKLQKKNWDAFLEKMKLGLPVFLGLTGGVALASGAGGKLYGKLRRTQIGEKIYSNKVRSLEKSRAADKEFFGGEPFLDGFKRRAQNLKDNRDKIINKDRSNFYGGMSALTGGTVAAIPAGLVADHYTVNERAKRHK